jgi:hypothetical protein
MPGAEVAQDPQVVAKWSSGSPRAAIDGELGTPSWHKHGVGVPLPSEWSEQHKRSVCQGVLGGAAPMAGRGRERKEGEEERRIG